MSAVYASHSRSRLGIFLQRDAKVSASCEMEVTLAVKSGHRMTRQSSIFVSTSRYRLYSLDSRSSSFSVVSSSS